MRSSAPRWYCTALRAIGALLQRAADRLDQRRAKPLTLEPVARVTSPEDYLDDLRHRIYSRYY